jgi:hypothetical protein
VSSEQAKAHARTPGPSADPDDDADDPLVARLRTMTWPEPDDATRERCLREFRQRLAKRSTGGS